MVKKFIPTDCFFFSISNINFPIPNRKGRKGSPFPVPTASRRRLVRAVRWNKGRPVRAVALGRSCGGRFALRAGAPAYVLHQGHPSIHATGSATPVVPVGKHTRW